MNRVILLGTGNVQPTIVSEASEEITGRILRLGRGATLLHGRTALLGRSCEVIICVVPIRLMNGIKRAALGADPGAFITVCPVRDVSGRGFTLADIDLPLGGAADGA